MSKELDNSKQLRMFYIIEEHVYLWAELSMTVGFDSSSSINGSDKMLGWELFPLSYVCLIKDGAPK